MPVLSFSSMRISPGFILPFSSSSSPDITSTEEAALEHLSEIDGEVLADEFAMKEDQASAETTNEAETSAPAVTEDAASGESTDEEKQDASPDAAN